MYVEPEIVMPMFVEPEIVEPEIIEPVHVEPEIVVPEITEPMVDAEEARGMGMRSWSMGPSYNVDNTYFDFANGYGMRPGSYYKQQSVGRSHAYPFSFGHGSGNHSPWNQEYYRHDAGLANYRFRPSKLE